ncbi:MAG: hypothetical protein R3B06_00325 [Kofleriaceae bacterium]
MHEEPGEGDLEVDAAPERHSDGTVAIERDHGCFRGLSWRAEIAAGDGQGLRARLGAMLEDVTRDARLIAMRTVEGHHVIVVPATGRVQVRLDLECARERRGELALALARLVHDAHAAG